MALASLIIKEKLSISDREVVEQIRENPYLQYFIGLSSYNSDSPFDPSMLCHFRQRITVDVVNKINQSMVRKTEERILDKSEKKTQKKPKKLK